MSFVKTYLEHFQSDFQVFQEDPKPCLPLNVNKVGRPFTKYRSDQEGIEVKELLDSLPPQRWKTVKVRETHLDEL